jgi:hypothetical protein
MRLCGDCRGRSLTQRVVGEEKEESGRPGQATGPKNTGNGWVWERVGWIGSGSSLQFFNGLTCFWDVIRKPCNK